MSRPLPASGDLGDLLKTLLGRGTVVSKAPPAVVSAKGLMICGVYLDDSGNLQAVCLADLRFSTFAAAALSLIPPGAAVETIKASQITDDIRDNIGEVLNVGARLLNVPGQSHVVLKGIHVMPGPIPDAVASLLRKPCNRVDYEAAITGYGSGRISWFS